MSGLYKVMYLANVVHEQLSNIWLPLPLQWSLKRKKWEFKNKWAMPHLISSIMHKSIACASLALVLVSGIENPGSSSATHMMALFMELITIMMTMLCDYILDYGGTELAICANWAYKNQSWIGRFGN